MDAHEATQTYDCKFPNCTREVKSRYGRYSYCDVHRGKAALAKSVAAGDSVEKRLHALAGQARGVDRAKARASKLTEQALAAKREADELERAFHADLRSAMGGDDGR
jgi:hypothetical protein